MIDLVTYEKDGIRYAKKELPRNSTLAVLKAGSNEIYRLYREIEMRMENRFENFSLVFDDGVIIHSLADDFIGFVMDISAQGQDVVITTTGDREFVLRYNEERLSPIHFDRFLTASRLEDSNFTNVFTSKSNTVQVNGSLITAVMDKDYNEIVLCDSVKRYGYLAAYTDKAYLICNNQEYYLFLAGHPECDISSQFKDLGFFWINNNDIMFRTDYGYIYTQDFLVRDISVNKGLAAVTCSTLANPDILFTLEV